jgi:5-methylcytosine-specific restriction endonuclease McrA
MIDKTSLRNHTPTIVKLSVPKALREQVWLHKIGRVFECPCTIKWCENTITTFDYHIGHNVPASRGGTMKLNNLQPICSRCNLSMGHQYTIREWNGLIT